MEQRLKLKSNLATALSDMGLTSKLPSGRLDTLVDRIAEAPLEFQALGLRGVGPTKHTPEWRTCMDWAMSMTVRPVKAPRVPRQRVNKLSKRVWVNEGGEITFKNSFLKELTSAGADYAADFGENMDDTSGICRDLAAGMLAMEGVDSTAPSYRTIVECAADIVHDGLSRTN